MASFGKTEANLQNLKERLCLDFAVSAAMASLMVVMILASFSFRGDPL